ncbi:MAG: SDR family NAD(P)-dependent oxidoreductase [Pseudomonadota bacterium]
MTDNGNNGATRSLVIGASGGIGAAFADALAERGPVDRLSRRDDGLDLKDEASLARNAAALAQAGRAYRLMIDATGVLEAAGRRPEKAFAEVAPDALADAFAVNATGPALLVKHFSPLLAPKGRSVFATLSARVGSIGDNRLGGWIGYRASKAALNQIVRCAALEIKRKRPESVVVALHPGTIETPLTRAYARGRYTASPEQAARQMLDVLDRLTPDETGGFYDYAGEAIVW